jgi:prepilin-type N-terminal cleavage/methylation domain-containing protein/prepilin-type processing-associated H-X9-DG protein
MVLRSERDTYRVGERVPSTFTVRNEAAQVVTEFWETAGPVGDYLLVGELPCYEPGPIRSEPRRVRITASGAEHMHRALPLEEVRMHSVRKPAFTLIELLVVISVMAIIAAILFPVFAHVRDRAHSSACSSNMRQIGAALMLYTQDYDETFPYVRFHGDLFFGTQSDRGQRIYGWNNAVAPYLRSIDVLGCPANRFSRTVPGRPASDPKFLPKPGANATGWEVEPGQRMPVSYGMNVCANTWWSADRSKPFPKPPPPLRTAQLARPAGTILICETNSTEACVSPWFLWAACEQMFTHPAGQVANFIFFDGHVKSKKWLSTLYPVAENNWEPGIPNTDPKNRTMRGAPGCDGLAVGDGSVVVPSGPESKEFQTPECLANR